MKGFFLNIEEERPEPAIGAQTSLATPGSEPAAARETTGLLGLPTPEQRAKAFAFEGDDTLAPPSPQDPARLAAPSTGDKGTTK